MYIFNSLNQLTNREKPFNTLKLNYIIKGMEKNEFLQRESLKIRG